MSVEVNTTSRAKSALIAMGVLVIGLAIIFAIRHFRDAAAEEQGDAPQSTESASK